MGDEVFMKIFYYQRHIYIYIYRHFNPVKLEKVKYNMVEAIILECFRIQK